MKKTRETEQYSNTNVRMLREPSPKNFYRKECPLKLVKKFKLAQPQCQIITNKINCKQKNKLKEKDKNYHFKSISI